MSRAGQNPAKQRTARISVNSALRGARSLFSPTRLKFITLPLGFTSPFASVALEPRQAMSYRSFFDIKILVANAQSELSRLDPEAFKAFLLASMVGLRRAEIDQLEWTAFDWQLEKLHIGVTEHFAVKSQRSIGDFDLDRELMVPHPTPIRFQSCKTTGTTGSGFPKFYECRKNFSASYLPMRSL